MTAEASRPKALESCDIFPLFPSYYGPQALARIMGQQRTNKLETYQEKQVKNLRGHKSIHQENNTVYNQLNLLHVHYYYGTPPLPQGNRPLVLNGKE
jgi:hypothetical protein